MKRSAFHGLGAVALWAGLAGTAAAADVALTVSIPSALAEGGTASTQLRMGVVSGATAGVDNRWDVPAPPTPAQNTVTLEAAIVSSPSANRPDLLWDFRDQTLPQSWTVHVTTDQSDPVTLGLSAVGSDDACTPVAWAMEDLYSGTRRDLDPGIPHVYTYAGSVPRTRAFLITVTAAPAPPRPASPTNLWSPRQGRTSVYLAWAPSNDASVSYHVYRVTDQGSARLTTSPLTATAYVDTGVDLTQPATYRVTAVTPDGCESAPSDGYRVISRR